MPNPFHVFFTPYLRPMRCVILIISQCFGMVAWRLNCAYRQWWNGALHCELLFLVTINIIKHYRWYICEQVPNCHIPFGPYGLQQIMHWSPLLVNGWGGNQSSSLVFIEVAMKYSHLNSRCGGKSTLLVFYIFDKLFTKKLDILGPHRTPKHGIHD